MENLYEDLNDLFAPDTNKKDSSNDSLPIVRQYKALFGHAIPYDLIPEIISEDEILEKVEKCVEHRSDNLLELLGVITDDNAVY